MSVLTTRGGRTIAIILAVCAAGSALIAGVSRASPGQTSGAMPTGAPVPGSEALSPERVFISGSLVNLREASSTNATVIKQVPIGTECVIEEKAGSGWWRIGCAESSGWTKAELLSAERPTLEPLLALAGDSKQPLKDRFDAGLRATALEPDHADARNLLWNLFAEQEWVQLEGILSKETVRRPQIHISVECEGASSTEACFMNALKPVYTDFNLKLFKFHDSERLGKTLFVTVQLLKPHEETKPSSLWVRTGTLAGDSNALDIQVFAESRYVPSDTLKSALEKLPVESADGSLSNLDVVLSSEKREAVRQLEGSWTQLFRRPQGLTRLVDCMGYSGRTITIKSSAEKVRVTISSQDDFTYDVGGVQLAKDGSLTLRAVTGETWKHAIFREDERVSLWTDGERNGFFVRSDMMDAFPWEQPSAEECDH